MRPPESLEWFLKHAERSERLDGANSFVSCTCWACGSDIRVHLNITSENIYMPPSQCGACGALTDHPDSGPPKISYGQPSALKQVLKVLSSYKQGVVAAVTLLVLTVVTLGSVVILPITCASSYWLWALNQVVTWTFTAFVFFFCEHIQLSPDCLYIYIQAVPAVMKSEVPCILLTPAATLSSFLSDASSIYSATSTVKACYGYSDKFPPKSSVPAGCYAGFTFCRDCQWFKVIL